MAEWWDIAGNRWEQEFDIAVRSAAALRLRESREHIHRLRAWQRRRTRHGRENHAWHEAELLWLEGVILERARRTQQASVVWRRLAGIFAEHRHLEGWFLPGCPTCASRQVPFTVSWLSVARSLRSLEVADTAGVVKALSVAARESVARMRATSNKRMQLTRPAMANGRRGPRS